MSHYSSSPRKGYVVIHHSGGPNNHTIETNAFCNFSGGGSYDFAVTRQGRIFVCSDSDGVLWRRTTGEHALGCNCRAVGIVMHGCFGGCGSGNVTAPSEAQECSVAFLMSHLETPDEASRVRPHANCVSWSPCGGGTSTVCPGTRFTSGSSWNSTGRAFRDRLRSRRRNWDNRDCCFGDPERCPI
jgi:hypothetical protein